MNKLEFESYLWSVSIFYYDKKKERQRWRRLPALLCSSEFSNGKTHTHTQQELMSIWVFRCVFATDLKARTNKSKQSNKIKLKAKQKKKKEKNLIEIIINLQSTLNKIFFLFTLLVSSARARARNHHANSNHKFHFVVEWKVYTNFFSLVEDETMTGALWHHHYMMAFIV